MPALVRRVGGAEARQRLASAWDIRPVEVATDAYIAWLGAHDGEDGAVVALGTGSIGYGQVEGRRHAVGGWGPLVSDEASGYAIGLSALRRAIWAADGRLATTPLADAVLSTVGGSAAAVAAFARGAEVVDIAALAPLVFRCARGDDPWHWKSFTGGAPCRLHDRPFRPSGHPHFVDRRRCGKSCPGCRRASPHSYPRRDTTRSMARS
jgi:N-acetylglucosamine kinase-like BadF-type ATPase